MRVTKHEHAALRIEKDGATLVVDPGSFTAALPDISDLAGIVITHEHPDHWTPEHLAALRARHPSAPVFTTRAVAAQLDGDAVVVASGDSATAGPFRLSFHGGVHNEIHSSIPLVENIGVFVDDLLYYPGDSYALPGREVPLLAAPIGAPWLKIGEAMDFVLAVAPRAAFGTHDVPLSAQGLAMHRGRLRWATEQGGGVFHDLDAGDAIDVG
ncbi:MULTISPECIES: MBL fold metallo-hydrolase [Microbacterium]|uniref:MBL fold metallo-hydrolase n=1 Tax=Microbacterium barkeri TaxID=33917 RepID=A0A9W6H0K7_9MICO|nr:MBL fold metallo-hydrolase [Microbacterium barkeri]MDI6941943.1 MBL fold metallo-hydrolase [Microbacterium barkeri]MDR6875817.1 L-ascorbate metabolism protein UlaG (beta-lactamase superfamily) [Microbacterium barkeri]GLJ59933.1 MBL fold metallo-hydrolase [Microbacterium barkeri]